MRESAKKQQKHKWLYRIASEVDWAVHNDRYMVYSTLTIDPRYEKELFCKDSVALKNVFRRIERGCQRAYYGSVKAYERAKAAGTAIPDDELVSHMAVAEYGGKRVPVAPEALNDTTMGLLAIGGLPVTIKLSSLGRIVNGNWNAVIPCGEPQVASEPVAPTCGLGTRMQKTGNG